VSVLYERECKLFSATDADIAAKRVEWARVTLRAA
jgi:hypothetical protein